MKIALKISFKVGRLYLFDVHNSEILFLAAEDLSFTSAGGKASRKFIKGHIGKLSNIRAQKNKFSVYNFGDKIQIVIRHFSAVFAVTS